MCGCIHATTVKRAGLRVLVVSRPESSKVPSERTVRSDRVRWRSFWGWCRRLDGRFVGRGSTRQKAGTDRTRHESTAWDRLVYHGCSGLRREDGAKLAAKREKGTYGRNLSITSDVGPLIHPGVLSPCMSSGIDVTLGWSSHLMTRLSGFLHRYKTQVSPGQETGAGAIAIYRLSAARGGRHKGKRGPPTKEPARIFMLAGWQWLGAGGMRSTASLSV